MCDKTKHEELAGCEELIKVVQNKVKPKVHLFGHIHEGKEVPLLLKNYCQLEMYVITLK